MSATGGKRRRRREEEEEEKERRQRERVVQQNIAFIHPAQIMSWVPVATACDVPEHATVAKFVFWYRCLKY